MSSLSPTYESLVANMVPEDETGRYLGTISARIVEEAKSDLLDENEGCKKGDYSFVPQSSSHLMCKDENQRAYELYFFVYEEGDIRLAVIHN